MACDFCRTRNVQEPCFKIRGPKTEAQIWTSRMEPSRLPATPIDAAISPEDALLLDYVYQKRWTSWTWLTPHLLKKFAVAFGPAIQRASLRQAMLAFLASILPPDQFQDRYDLHEQSAICELRKCISKLDVDYGDLFAAYLLLYIQTPGSSAEVIHARGCLSTSPA